MSFNGSGTFLINSTGQPVVANTVISATVFNALTADLASGLTNCITKDGQSTPTANIPMGSNKITGLANGTLTSDAATLGQVQTTAAKLIGSISGVDTITGVMSPTLPAYAAGQLFYFVAGGANTGAVTLNIDSLGAKAVTRDGSTALAAGDINSGEMVVVIYDGTRFQMINAANSFGNTTINGTLTVTGKSNLAEVSSPSINASVAVINALTATGASIASANAATAVVTNLTATNASVASVNAGVALVTTATVTSLTATGASIASANIGNLQFTAASIASINAGVAVVTDLTATGASIASANVGTAVITTGTVTSLTATSASVASANAGTAVITNGTVTNLTSTSASIASANAAVALITTGTVTNLTSTAASVASANIGTAVITGLTATGASIASANAGNLQVTGASVASANLGTAVITTGTVTNLTSTSASVASANLGVALVTTGTVTNLTSTAASIASANIGVAAIGSLSFTGASIASLNAGVAVINNLTATSASIASMNGSVASITTVNATTVDATNVEVTNVKANDGTAAITISDSTGSVNIGSTVSYGGLLSVNRAQSAGIADLLTLRDASAGVTLNLQTYGDPTYGTASRFNFGGAYLAIRSGTDERMRISSSGNVGIGGTASTLAKLHLLGTYPTSGNSTVVTRVTGTIPSGSTSSAIIFQSNPITEAASFTLSSLSHFYAAQQTLGAGSTVTNQYAFNALSTLTGATNNYGFYSNIASGSNRWNFYAAGTAANYFEGTITTGGNIVAGGYVRTSDGTEANPSLQPGVDGDTGFYRPASNTIGFVTNGTEYARLKNDGEFITGGTTDNGAYNLQCNGTGVWGAGAYVNGSDERLKDDITTLNDGLNVVSQLRPVTFKYKPDYLKDQNVQTGFIAQELQAVLAGKDYADGVVQAGPEYLNVAYQSLIPILVKAVQELKAELDTLKDNV